MNKLLPPDIDIFDVSEESIDFNARYKPKMRAYEYIITWKKDFNLLQPSILAASSNSHGMEIKNAQVFHMAKGRVKEQYIRISPI